MGNSQTSLSPSNYVSSKLKSTENNRYDNSYESSFILNNANINRIDIILLTFEINNPVLRESIPDALFIDDVKIYTNEHGKDDEILIDTIFGESIFINNQNIESQNTKLCSVILESVITNCNLDVSKNGSQFRMVVRFTDRYIPSNNHSLTRSMSYLYSDFGIKNISLCVKGYRFDQYENISRCRFHYLKCIRIFVEDLEDIDLNCRLSHISILSMKHHSLEYKIFRTSCSVDSYTLTDRSNSSINKHIYLDDECEIVYKCKWEYDGMMNTFIIYDSLDQDSTIIAYVHSYIDINCGKISAY